VRRRGGANNGDSVRHESRLALPWFVLVLVVLALAVEVYARRTASTAEASPTAVPTRCGASVILSAPHLDDAPATLSSLRGTGKALVILGSSQIDTVKGGAASENSPHRGVPFPVALACGTLPSPYPAVVDLSTGGETVAESVVLTAAWLRDHPRNSTLLVGVSSANVTTAAIRPGIAKLLLDDSVRDIAVESAPSNLRAALDLSLRSAQREEHQDPTPSQRLDRVVSDILDNEFVVFQRRGEYFESVRRAVTEGLLDVIRARLHVVQVARTASLAGDYDNSLIYLSTLFHMARRRNVKVWLLLVPVNGAASPPPLASRDVERLYDDLSRIAKQDGAAIIDAHDLLSTSRFGFYSDGSADAFHFDAIGHAKLAKFVAQHLRDDR
jgi:hypothetical protein